MSEVTFEPQDASKQKHRQAGLQRKLRTLLFGAISSSALIATPQLAHASFTPNPSVPNFLASGTETTSQSVTMDNAQVTTDATFSVNTATGSALAIAGNGALVYNDANSAALVTSGNSSALFVNSTGDAGGTPGSITITTNGNLSGGETGIRTTNNGTGDTNITATGTVSGTGHTSIGISAANAASANDLTVEAATVSGAIAGIYVVNAGLGDTSITATGTVTASGNTGTGINVTNAATGNDLTVVTAAVSGGVGGVKAINYGTGDTSITTGNVTTTANTGIGINVSNAATGNDLTVETAAVSTGVTGISAANNGSGNTKIKATGTITTTANTGIGINVTNAATAKDLTIEAAAITGGNVGISAINTGTGNTSVTVTGAVNVSGNIATGIGVTNSATAKDLTVEAAAVTGGNLGIYVRNSGIGNTSITATDVTAASASGTAVDVTNDATAHDLTVSVNKAIGTAFGIRVLNDGTTDLDDPDPESAKADTTITATGKVTATTGTGILVDNNSGTNNLTVDVQDVHGGQNGIMADNDGTGNTSITTGDVTIVAGDGRGIDVTNGATANDITVNAGLVTGGKYGINAVNNGTGDTSITATGKVTATGASGTGIHVENASTGHDITVQAAAVEGGDIGIYVQNNGTGDSSVTTTGDVTGSQGHGVHVYNFLDAGNVTVSATSVTGGESGVYIQNQGKGDTNVTATGTVTGDGQYGIFVNNSSNTGKLTINAASTVGEEHGILAQNGGTGDTQITSTGTAEGKTGDGIRIINYASSNNLTLNANEATGQESGIWVQAQGRGNTTITATGDVTGETEYGVYATNSATTQNLTVNVAAATGAITGIYARNNGGGNTSITATGTVEGTSAIGIDVENAATAHDITINVAAVTGNDYGIKVENKGGVDLNDMDADSAQSDTTVTATGKVTATGANSTGIYINNEATGHDVTVNVAAVEGGDSGMYIMNNGTGETTISATGDVSGQDGMSVFSYASGDTSVTTTGTVTGTDGGGMDIYHRGPTGDLTLNVAAVTGQEYGIIADNEGSGSTSITATGTVTGNEDHGIYAVNNGKDLTLNVVAVTGGESGILAYNNGTGTTSITATGTVTGAAGGVYVTTEGAGLTLNVAAVIGGETGITATNNGTGNTSLTASGTITGEDGDGVYLSNSSTGEDVTVNVAAVNGTEFGMHIMNNGSGDTSVTATGAVVGDEDSGIQVSHYGKNLTVNAADVTGGAYGIYATNYGTGDTSVTASGTVTGTEVTGVYALNSTNSQNLSVNVAAVTGGEIGIRARNNGGGNTSIIATGAVEGTTDIGISVDNSTTAHDLTVSAAAVTGSAYGIQVLNNGGVDASDPDSDSAQADTSVTATGKVTATGATGTGIHVENAATGHDIKVNAAAVEGGAIGIHVKNNGTGDTSITATGTVVGTSETGINVGNEETAHDLTVNTNNVTGGEFGLRVSNYGTGNTSISSTGTIEGTNAIGIHAINGSKTQDLTLNVNNVTANSIGILAGNSGSGDTSITATGTVEGTQGVGIAVTSASTTRDLTVNANNVIGGMVGININNNGTGDTRVTSVGTVTGTGEDSFGILVQNDVTANDLTLEVNNVTGLMDGIGVTNNGTGNTNITATGTVEGTQGNGIDVVNAQSAHDLSVDVAAVTGSAFGITATNNGGVDANDSNAESAQADTFINASGKVTATHEDGVGIAATNQSTANHLIVHAAAVEAGKDGIVATNNGTGETFISSLGSVVGTAGNGITATNGSAASNLTMYTAAVTGSEYGIHAENFGTGNTSIQTTGTVTGSVGIRAVNITNSQSVNLTVHTMAVTGVQTGISVSNAGTGNTSVTATGTVAATATDGYGIYAANGPSAQDLTVNAVSVTGALFGVQAINYGTGDTSVTTTGTVTSNHVNGDAVNVSNAETAGDITVNVLNASGGELGIVTRNSGSGKTTLIVGGVVEGGSTGIQTNSQTGQAIEINNNGTVRNLSQSPTGQAITSSQGAVTINNNQLLLGTVSLGDDDNTINNVGTWDVAGGTNELGDGSNLIDNKASGTIIAANASGPVTTTFNGVGNFIHSGEIVLQNQEAGGQVAYVGDVAIFTNGGNGTFQSNGGRVLLDTDFETGASDRLVVDNVTVGSAPTRVYINPVGLVKPTTSQGINVVEVGGTSADDAFVLGNSVGDGVYAFELGRGQNSGTEQDWYLRNSGIIRGEVPMAGALSVLAGRTSLATLSSLHERQREGGDGSDNYASLSGTRLVSRSSTVTLPEADRTATKGVWGRVFGQNNNFSSNGGLNAGYDTKLWGAQAGIDLLAKGTQETGRTYAGIYLGHASSSGDGLRGNTRLGTLKVDATTLGAYYTNINSNGLYWDAVAQYSRISDAKMKYLGETTDTEGSSYLASLEAGKQFNRQSKYVTEVQGQLLYQKTSIDNMTLPDSTRFDVGSQSGFTGRVGVRLARNPHQGASFQPWVSANIWRTFNQDARVTSLGESVSTPAGGTTGEVQLGFSLAPRRANGWSAYFSGGYQFDVSGSEYSGWKGSLGVRKGW